MTWADVLANAKTKAPFSSLKKRAQPLLQKQHSILFSTIPSRDQDSGKKVVTQNDADDDADEEAKNGLLLTKGNAAHPAAAAGVVGKKRGIAATAKPLCKFHPKCFRKVSTAQRAAWLTNMTRRARERERESNCPRA